MDNVIKYEGRPQDYSTMASSSKHKIYPNNIAITHIAESGYIFIVI